MKKSLMILSGVTFLFFMLNGCTHLESRNSVEINSSDRWGILPFQNLAETPRAGEQVETILQSLMLGRGVEIAVYPKDETGNLALLINDEKRMNRALQWAAQQGIRYGVTGSVQEWRYKTGLDGEPAVGITVRVLDLQNDVKPFWSATASRTGWGSENLTATTTKVLKALLDEIEFSP